MLESPFWNALVGRKVGCTFAPWRRNLPACKEISVIHPGVSASVCPWRCDSSGRVWRGEGD